MSNQAQKNILDFVSPRNYKLVTDITTINSNNDTFTYICSCGEKRSRRFYDIVNNVNKSELSDSNYVPKCCIKLIDSTDGRYKWYTDNSINTYTVKDENWIRFQQYWVSSKGKVIGKKGENLVVDGYIKTSKKIYSIIDLMIKAFDIKLENDVIPYFKDNIVNIDNISFRENYLSYIKNIKIEELSNVESKDSKQFPDYKIYKNGIVFRKSTGKAKERIPSYENKNGRLVVKFKNSIRYNIDVIIASTFSDFIEEENYERYNTDVDITHIDGDYSNCSFDNLKLKFKDPSKEKQRQIRENERIKTLREYVKSYINNNKYILISDIENIKTVFDIFEYKCNCKNIFKKSIKHVKDNNESTECVSCRSLTLKTKNLEEGDILINDIKYKKFEYGWISENGEFINNNKESISISKGMVKICGEFQNAKRLIAITYKIPHYEYANKKAFFIKTKDGSKNIAPTNLFIWGNSRKETIHLPLSKQFEDELSTIDLGYGRLDYFVLDKPPSCEWKTNPTFPENVFYRVGIINVSENTYTRGRIRSTGYCDVKINGKMYNLHRVLCFVFHPIEGKTKFEEYKELEVNHKDGVKLNNHVDNLEWVTKSENIRHAIDTGLTGYTYPVKQYELLEDGSKGNLIKEFSCIKYAIEETGQSRNYIMNMCQGKSKPYKYYWEFVNKEDIEKSQTKKRIKLTADSKPEILEDEDIPMTSNKVIVPK
jgi:predicted SprT family Zn-dependent metalloprotease